MGRRRGFLALATMTAVGACGSRTGVDVGASENAASDAGANGVSDPAADASPIPLAVSCPNAPGVQPSAAWPMARRCPARAGSTPALGPAARPSVAWTTRPGYGEAPLVIAADGTVYFAASEASAVAIVYPGKPWQGWGAHADGFASVTSLAIGSNGALYVAGSAQRGAASLAALSEGAQQRMLVAACGPTDLTIGADGTVYVLADGTDPTCLAPAQIVAFGPDGSAKWHAVLTSDDPVSAWAEGIDGHLYLIARTHDPNGRGAELVAFDPAQQAIAWTVPVALPAAPASRVSSPVVADDGTIVVADGLGVLSITPTGTVRWRLSLPSANVTALAAGHDGTSYTADAASGALYAIHSDGTLAWRYAAAIPTADSSIVVDGAGRVYFGAAGPGGAATDAGVTDDTVALSAGGALLWKLDGGGSPIALGADGLLYTVHAAGGGIAALRP